MDARSAPAAGESQLERARRLYAAMDAVAAAITAQDELEGVFQVIVEAARSLLDARAAILYHISPDGASLQSAAFSYAERADRCPAPPGGFMVPLNDGLIAEVFRVGEVVRLAELAEHARYHGLPDGHMPIHRLIAVALRDREGVGIGLLMASDRLDARPFDEADEEIVRLLARQGGLAIHNAQLLAQLRGANEHLEATVARRTSELAQKNLELAHANRLKSEFLAKMSHELRTPLNAIIGFSDMLQKQLYGPLNEQQCDGLERVVRNGRQLLAMINDVLDLSKIEAEAMPVQLETFDPRDAVLQALFLYESVARKKGLRLSYELDGAPSEVHSDLGKIRQIAQHLLANAVNFTEAGEVRVELARHGAHWELVVTDTGIGIAPPDRERIFDEFYQVDSSTTRKVGGTGLGLPICVRLAHLLGGSVGVESELGVGSRFWVSLPVVSRESEGARAAEGPW